MLASGTGDDSGRLVSRYHEHLPGLMPSELDSMPTLLCPPDHALLETPDKCSICLSLFQAQDRLRLLPVSHHTLQLFSSDMHAKLSPLPYIVSPSGGL